MVAVDWVTPETWVVGDKINADLWLRRWYDPVNLLLRRPLTVVHRTTDFSCPNGGQNLLSFDVVDQDDDGMVLSGTANTFYCKRPGVFTVFFSAPFINNGQTGSHVGVRIRLNGAANLFTRQGNVSNSTSGKDTFKALSADVTLTEGDYIQFHLVNFLSSAITVKAEFNGPRAVILWKKPPA